MTALFAVLGFVVVGCVGSMFLESLKLDRLERRIRESRSRTELMCLATKAGRLWRNGCLLWNNTVRARNAEIVAWTRAQVF